MYGRGAVFCVSRRLCSSFQRYGLAPELCQRLAELGISSPTTVQEKSLELVLSGRSAVINAETGSGKTLCYLLPAVQTVLRGQSLLRSLVLVPTPDLAIQVGEVFSDLTRGNAHYSVVYSGSRLSLLPSTHLVVATPTSLMNYDLPRLLRGIGLLCVDEVDVLLTGAEKTATQQLLSYGGRKEEEGRQQLIVTAATLPHGGPKTAGSLLRKWLPRDTTFITTHLTHHTVSSSQHIFTPISSQNSSISRDSLNKIKLTQLAKDLDGFHGNQSRILVFTNTQQTAEDVYHYLLEDLSTPPPWWRGHVGQLHGGVEVEERGRVVQRVRGGDVKVLVTTDLLSRGIDLPDLTAVIQFDFSQNSAHYLHRAGRTARAGKDGKVVSYVTEEDHDLAEEIQKVLNDDSRSFQEIFSRNKMLRRKINAHKTRDQNRTSTKHSLSS